MKGVRAEVAAWTGLWLALVAVALATRPLLPIDETRYASVAWEMWLRHSFLVPYVNGAPYGDKPPLLFWLILAGWKLFGVSEVWMRLVAPLFALGCVFLVYRLGRELWPERPETARVAAWALLGTAAWALYGTLLLFDFLMGLFVLVALLGVVRAWRRGGWAGWLLAGVGLGLGVLSKGPVVLVHVAPAALLAPWWVGGRARSWARWYAGLLGALLLAAAIGLAWAIPAARAGGPEYASRILWHQTADRLVHSFAHRRPFWWYLPLLPLVLFPWSVSPAVWRGLERAARGPRDPGVRLLAAWALSTLVIFSAISGKQLHYLLPAVPAFALLAARGMTADGFERRRADRAPPAVIFGVIGVALLVARPLVGLAPGLTESLPPWTARVSPLGGAITLAAVAGVAAVRAERWRVPALASLALLTLAVLHLAVMRYAGPYYDLRPAAMRIHEWQAEGRPIANAATYHSQFQFLGRLERPVEQIRLEDAVAWIRAHPGGKVVTYPRRLPADLPVPPDYVQPFKGRTLAVWGERAVLAAPEWPPRPGPGG